MSFAQGGVLPYITSFQRRFLELSIIFRTCESSSFVSSHLKLFKDRLLLKIRFNALTSTLLYSCCNLERSIKNWPISRTGYQVKGKFFIERGANLESRAAHSHPKNTPGGSFVTTWAVIDTNNKAMVTLRLTSILSGIEAVLSQRMEQDPNVELHVDIFHDSSIYDKHGRTVDFYQ